MKTAEKILREYINFEDVNQSETVELLPLTMVDAMEEYATQCQEDMAEKYTEEDITKAIFLSSISNTDFIPDRCDEIINSLNKQD